MPLHNVDAMDAELKEAAHHEKLAQQVADTKERAKCRIPKAIVKQFNASKAPRIEAAPPPIPLDPATELNVKLGAMSIAMTVLSMPIAEKKRPKLRCNLEGNEFIRNYVNRRITSTIVDIVAQGADELRFAFNYGTEYLKAYSNQSSCVVEVAE
jgi:hypothetical protein